MAGQATAEGAQEMRRINKDKTGAHLDTRNSIVLSCRFSATPGLRLQMFDKKACHFNNDSYQKKSKSIKV